MRSNSIRLFALIASDGVIQISRYSIESSEILFDFIEIGEILPSNLQRGKDFMFE